MSKAALKEEGFAVIRSAVPQPFITRACELLCRPVSRSRIDDHGQYPLVVRLDPLLTDIPAVLKEDIKAWIGTETAYMHMPPMARAVFPGHGEAVVPAHQDVTYNRHLGKFIVLWVPLTPITEAHGGLAVFPFSHRLGLLTPKYPKQGWSPAIDTAAFRRVCLQPLDPGDIVVMDDHLVHESVPNRSDSVRLSLDYRLFGTEGHSEKPFLNLDEHKCA